MTDETANDVLVQLATRIPKNLHRAVKIHCVRSNTSVMAFVVQALSERLQRQSRTGRRRAAG